jgi:uncharacterized protein (DUF3084 family)
MNKTRITLISLVLGLAGACTAAWGAESVMNLISQGEAIQSEVEKAKSGLDEAVQKNHDMAAEGKKLQGEQEQFQQDMAAWQKENDAVKQHTADYTTNCGAKDKKLTDDEFKACKADHDQLAADITRVNGEIPGVERPSRRPQGQARQVQRQRGRLQERQGRHHQPERRL